MRLTQQQMQVLADALNRTLASHTPEWTNHNDADPGVTILEVMAFLAEELAYRDRIERGASAAARVIAALERLDTSHPKTSVGLAEEWSGTKRPHYFAGRLLGPDDFKEEQNYVLDKHRRHLRHLHGIGIVHGLQVEVDDAGAAIDVSPGLAVDGYGREVSLSKRLTLSVPDGTSSPALLIVEYVERFTDPVPVADDEAGKPSRIEEGCQIAIASEPSKSGVAVARLVSAGDTWRIDATFSPQRC